MPLRRAIPHLSCSPIIRTPASPPMVTSLRTPYSKLKNAMLPKVMAPATTTASHQLNFDTKLFGCLAATMMLSRATTPTGPIARPKVLMRVSRKITAGGVRRIKITIAISSQRTSEFTLPVFVILRSHPVGPLGRKRLCEPRRVLDLAIADPPFFDM